LGGGDWGGWVPFGGHDGAPVASAQVELIFFGLAFFPLLLCRLLLVPAQPEQAPAPALLRYWDGFRRSAERGAPFLGPGFHGTGGAEVAAVLVLVVVVVVCAEGDFLVTRQSLVKIDEGQQKIKIVRTNRQSNLGGSCQSIFSLAPP